ncbi:hypothetical protein ABZP36_026294 [Zizania latifolia]
MHAMRAAVFTISCVLALVVVADDHVVQVQARRHGRCHPFSCGHLRNISYPFRRRGDPPRCGVSSYEIDCINNSKAAIRINTGTYYVSSISYNLSSFWVVDANLNDTSSSCPLPLSDQVPYVFMLGIQGPHDSWDLALDHQRSSVMWAIFVNCSQELTNNTARTYISYIPVDCLSTSSSFVYISIDADNPYIQRIEPSCGYLAMIPFGDGGSNASKALSGELTVDYADIVDLIRGGFPVKFPSDGGPWTNLFGLIEKCLNKSIR